MQEYNDTRSPEKMDVRRERKIFSQQHRAVLPECFYVTQRRNIKSPLVQTVSEYYLYGPVEYERAISEQDNVFQRGRQR